jgi:hypothetical protein
VEGEWDSGSRIARANDFTITIATPHYADICVGV